MLRWREAVGTYKRENEEESGVSLSAPLLTGAESLLF